MSADPIYVNHNLIAKGLARYQINEDPLYLEILSGCKARIASLRGKITEASLWPGAVNETSAGPSMFCFLEIPVITECRLLVTGKIKACLSDALARTALLREQFQAKGSYCQLLDILVLDAVARYMAGDAALAQESLGKALQEAEPSGWIRPFVEQGPVVLEILGQMKASWKSTDIVGMILAALMEKDAGGSGEIESEPEEPVSVANLSQPLIDPITNREMEILCLLAKHLYNKEIAEQLFISPETVKTHLKRIYEKLMVSNRRQAVDRAYELGLLKDHGSL